MPPNDWFFGGVGMTTVTEANIRLAAILAEAEKLHTTLGVAILQENNLVPESIETGMAAQALATGSIGKDVAGWKVAINGERAVAAPLLDLYHADQGAAGIVTKPGAKAIELEICFVLGDDIEPPAEGTRYSREDVLSKIASIHMGAEMVSYRLIEESRSPFPLHLADRLGNHSFILGPKIDKALMDQTASQDASLPKLKLESDGKVLFDAAPKHPQNDPLGPLLAYANAPLDHLGGLRRGQVVTTGSLCGLVRLDGEKSLQATWGDVAKMDITLPA
jgi:2-keto-4-pentenoate hydratase